MAPNGRIDVAWYDARYSPKADLTTTTETWLPGRLLHLVDRRGRTFSPNVRITDRSIDRSIGVWSNNVDSHHNVGVASADDAVFFAWQDSRNGNRETNAEDVYIAALELSGTVTETSSASMPWGLLAVGIAFGLGAGMVLAAAFTRRAAYGAGPDSDARRPLPPAAAERGGER